MPTWRTATLKYNPRRTAWRKTTIKLYGELFPTVPRNWQFLTDEAENYAQGISIIMQTLTKNPASNSPYQELLLFSKQLDKEYNSNTEIQKSVLDNSVNFIIKRKVGTSETRFVQRNSNEIIVYLSSQTGCNKACRFCHLTQSGQTAFSHENIDQYKQQARLVLKHYSLLLEAGLQPASFLNYNFMSRGELFANNDFMHSADNIIYMLGDLAFENNLYPRYKCSTIMPKEMDNLEFIDVFKRSLPDIYYSIYSVDPIWRKKWMPQAGDPFESLEKLARWQMNTRKIPVIHWALISGGAKNVVNNCNEKSIEAIAAAIVNSGLKPDINIVRYNPANQNLGKEPEQNVIDKVANQLKQRLPWARVQIVGRVGHDVKASCGMFVIGKEAKRPQGLGKLPMLASSSSTFV